MKVLPLLLLVLLLSVATSQTRNTITKFEDAEGEDKNEHRARRQVYANPAAEKIAEQAYALEQQTYALQQEERGRSKMQVYANPTAESIVEQAYALEH